MSESLKSNGHSEAMELLEYTGLDAYVDYSGRGMFGAECFGVRAHSEDEVSGFLEENKHRWEYLTERGMRVDSLGMGLILYWPKLKTSEWTDAEKSAAKSA